jgi:Ca-activated chloride channel family protein
MTFQWPLLLLSLGLIPILIGLYLLAQRRRRRYTVRFTNLALLDSVIGRSPGWRRHIPPLIFLIGLAALLVSLARPTAVISTPHDTSSVMLAIDVSGSMAATDVQPSRLAAAKKAASTFVNALPKDAEVGLVSFSDTAHVNAPLTRDHGVMLGAIESLRANGGTAIGDGLGLALDQLMARPADAQGQRPPGLIVLLSDGRSNVGTDPMSVTARAKQANIRVDTVGVGQRGVNPMIGRQYVGELDEQTLSAIASETGGEYFYASEAGQLQRIYADLGSRVSWVREQTEITALVSALGAVFLLAGGLLSLRWFQQFP